MNLRIGDPVKPEHRALLDTFSKYRRWWEEWDGWAWSGYWSRDQVNVLSSSTPDNETRALAEAHVTALIDAGVYEDFFKVFDGIRAKEVTGREALAKKGRDTSKWSGWNSDRAQSAVDKYRTSTLDEMNDYYASLRDWVAAAVKKQQQDAAKSQEEVRRIEYEERKAAIELKRTELEVRKLEARARLAALGQADPPPPD